MRSPRTKTLLAAAILSSVALGLSCKSKKKPVSPQGSVQGTDKDELALLALEDAPDGLLIRLREGDPRAPRAAKNKVAKAEPLSAADVDRLLARVAKVGAQADDKKRFALRDRSLPPPRTGKTVKVAFPGKGGPPPTASTAKTSELEVSRFAPEGEVPIAPHLSVTFNQPMVAVTSHAGSIKGTLPVQLSPQPAGNWRWVGTRTLLFDPDVRFPMATEYEVRIPAGTASKSGKKLKKAVAFSFVTPAPTVLESYPTSGPQPLEPLLFARFDQKIDEAAVLKTVRIRAGGKSHSVRAATPEELRKDQAVQALLARAEDLEHQGRTIVFRAVGKLPPDTHVSVDIGPGTPSVEGPRKTAKAQSFSFRTYGPFRVEEARCSYGNQCPPSTPWTIRMSNPIDADLFEPSSIRIEPELERAKLVAQGQYLTIYGQSKGRTTYTVTLPAELADVFDQTLGNEEALTFRVGDADPQLFGQSGLVIADPAATKPTFDLHSINVKSLSVKIYRVQPGDWQTFTRFMQSNPRQPQPPPGTKVFDKNVRVEGPIDEMAETSIDLSSAISGDYGHAVVDIEPTNWPHRYKPQIKAWIQATDIGIDAFVDSQDLTAWATELDDGKPAKGVKMELKPAGTSATTDASGLVTIGLPRSSTSTGILFARRGKDVAFLPENTYYWSNHSGWTRRDLGDQLRWFVFDDRHMYRPKETVHLKGWLRSIDNGEGGDVGGPDGVKSVHYVVKGPRGNEITKGQTRVNALGGFDARFALPDTPNLGYAQVILEARGGRLGSGSRFHHSFQIQEFRRPEFEVTATASPGPHMIGEGADVTASAQYYAGGSLPGAPVSWSVYSQPTSYVPPDRSDFVFGSWVPWWGWHHHEATPPNHQSFEGQTDSSGKHVLHMDFVSVKPARPMSVIAEARVTDVNRQAWAAQSTLLVHPSDLYIGLKRERYFVDKGEPIELDTIVVDHDGNAIVDHEATVKAVLMDWTYENGEYKEVETDEQVCVVRSAADAVPCEFKTPEGGTYKITATVTDDRGRPNQTELIFWVSGGKRPPERNVAQEQVTLIPNKDSYEPGDTAEILVQSPFYPAEGLLSLRRSGITRTERFELEGPTTTLKVPIEDTHTPNVYVQVDVVGSAKRLGDDGEERDDLPRRPAYGAGSLNLPVPPVKRTLQVDIRPGARKIEPGGKTHVDVRVRDSEGQPVRGAELAVVVVDESVLALSGFQTPNPLAAFYTERPPGASDYHARQYVNLARPDIAALGGASGAAQTASPGAVRGGVMIDGDMAGAGEMEEAEAAPMDDSAPKPAPAPRQLRAEKSAEGRVAGNNAAPIAVRKNFNALAVFAPSVTTDASGRARVKVEVPDNLTRYRVMVAAVHGERRFGSGESNITARMPLMVRASPPRFLNFGDKFAFPVVLQNQTDAPMQVQVAMRTTNAALTQGAGRSVTVPANDRVEVRFPAAAEMPGTARFQIAAASSRWADASEISLPVWTPATTEAFATYGEIDSGALRQPVEMPDKVVEEFGGLEITTSSTQLQALTDAVLYLVHYPYECAEQTSSRILAIAALRDVLDAFAADDMPSKAELNSVVERDIKQLRSLQNWDGGFAFWVRGHESWPYISIHAAHALTRAKDKGYTVPADMLERSKRYLREIERHIPGWYPIEVRRTLIAYALYVRKRMGDPDAARARKLISEAGLDKLNMEAIGWLLGTLTGDASSQSQLTRIHRYLDNKVTETAAAANWSTSYSDGAHLILHSSRRADGVILESLIADKPKSDLIPKVVRGLLAHRVRGKWLNTQENVFVLLAMDAYFQTYEKATPNFVARLWVGDGFVGDQKFRGRSTDRNFVEVPMSYLADKGDLDVTLDKKGKGRLYYRIGMTYAPESLKLEPSDHGFAVERMYEPIDDPNDVVRMPDGSWKIRAGAAVRVRLTMVAENRRYHVALVDPLPAGLEPMNPALKVTGSIPADPKAQGSTPFWWWMRPWYEHQNLRDERVEAFASLLWAGVHEYTYVARATTPGRFVVPPTKAEEMYFPETFGRAASDVVVVK